MEFSGGIHFRKVLLSLHSLQLRQLFPVFLSASRLVSELKRNHLFIAPRLILSIERISLHFESFDRVAHLYGRLVVVL